MKRILGLLLVALMLSVSVVAMAEESSYFKTGDYNADVVAVHLKLAELGYYSLRPESPWNEASARALQILQENLDEEITGEIRDKEQVEEILLLENVVGKNLAVGSSSDWSEWFTPQYDVQNSCWNPFYDLRFRSQS